MRRTSVFVTMALVAGFGIGFFARNTGAERLEGRDLRAADLASVEILHSKSSCRC